MEATILLSTLSGLVSLAALINFSTARKGLIMAQGVKDERMARMALDLERAHEKIRDLEGCIHANDKELGGIKKDVEYIRISIDEIKSMLFKEPKGAASNRQKNKPNR